MTSTIGLVLACVIVVGILVYEGTKGALKR